jgi:hypothetical protein
MDRPVITAGVVVVESSSLVLTAYSRLLASFRITPVCGSLYAAAGLASATSDTPARRAAREPLI